jgi:hypothetical protein
MGEMDVNCPSCGRENPPAVHCAYCGALLHPPAGGRERGFAAAPHQHLRAPAVVATLFPHLPLRGDFTFRVLLAAGCALIASLALAGLFPVALIAAAVVVPVLVILYFREVDLYEQEPLRVLALTVLWGAAAGLGVGFLHDAVENAGAVLAPQTSGHAVLWDGILLPLIGVAVVLGGPLVLLRHRSFNDVLDGVTFGGAAAVTFAGAALLTHSSTFLAAGLAPAGLVAPWTLRLLTLGIAVPVLDAAALGAAAGSFWLRYRSSPAERARHGWLGRPALAVAGAGVLLVGSALLQLYLDPWAALAAVAALAGVGLVWLRALIHVGLLEERGESERTPLTACPNCHRVVFGAAFCSYCGVAVRALPKHGRAHEGHNRRALIARFTLALAAIVGAALIAIAVAEPAPYRPSCPVPQTGCATPLRVTGIGGPGRPEPRPRTWQGLDGARVTYDARLWSVQASKPRDLDIAYQDRLELTIQPQAIAGRSDEQLLEDQLSFLRSRYPDLQLDGAHPLASVDVGAVSGIGGLYAGHDAIDGSPVEVLIEVATKDGVNVVVSAWTSEQAQTSTIGAATAFDVLTQADVVLESFEWPSASHGTRR